MSMKDIGRDEVVRVGEDLIISSHFAREEVPDRDTHSLSLHTVWITCASERASYNIPALACSVGGLAAGKISSPATYCASPDTTSGGTRRALPSEPSSSGQAAARCTGAHGEGQPHITAALSTLQHDRTGTRVHVWGCARRVHY